MNTKTVYQTDKDGWFVSAVDADESPLEEGVFLIPAGCVEVAPPQTVPTGSYPKWDGTQWVVTAIPAVPTPVVDPAVAAFNAMQAQLIALQKQLNDLQASVIQALPTTPAVATPSDTTANSADDPSTPAGEAQIEADKNATVYVPPTTDAATDTSSTATTTTDTSTTK